MFTSSLRAQADCIPLLRARRLALCVTALLLSACTSLSPQVAGSAVDYSTVMEEFNNQVLIVNVLRARDQSPLNFSDLPIIRGSISQQSSASALGVFGASASTSARNSLGTGVQFSTSPTFDTSSLNNEAFVLNMLQPVSPTYMESVWHTGYSRELLLNLFAESIQLPSDSSDGQPRIFYNNPDAQEAASYQAFVQVVGALVRSGADLRSFTVLDPVGPPLMSAAGTLDGRPFVPTNSVNDGFFGAMMQLDPARYQVGNVAGEAMVSGKRTPMAGFQVYRRNAAQIGLCVDSARLMGIARQLQAYGGSPDVARQIEDAAHDLASFAGARTRSAVALSGASSSGHDPAPMSHPHAHSTAAQATTTAAPLDSAYTPPLRHGDQVVRITGMLDNRVECGTQEHLSPMLQQDQNASDAARLGYIRWRSPIDVYNYLGALLRHEADPARTPSWSVRSGGPLHQVFEMHSGAVPAGPGQVTATVNYRGAPYTVIGQSFTDAPSGQVVHSMQVLTLLSQLVSISKHTGDIPVTRSIEVLP